VVARHEPPVEVAAVKYVMEELAEARDLIRVGDYERALDDLIQATDESLAQGDAVALGEARRLAQQVWRQAPAGSETGERADRLVLAITRSGRYETPRSRPVGNAVVVWTVFLLVVGALVVLLALILDLRDGSQFIPRWIVALFGAVISFLFAWVRGLFFLRVRKRDR
jgi:hypothetical protein